MSDTKHIAFENMGTNVRALVDARVREVSEEMSGIVQSQLQKQRRISTLTRRDVVLSQPQKITNGADNVIRTKLKTYQKIGMNINTGKLLEGSAHLKQSIYDILTTTFSSRVMRRNYGSEIKSLIDATGNKTTIVGIYYAIAVALDKWEPRFDLTHIYVSDQNTDGKISFILKGIYYQKEERIEISVLNNEQ